MQQAEDSGVKLTERSALDQKNKLQVWRAFTIATKRWVTISQGVKNERTKASAREEEKRRCVDQNKSSGIPSLRHSFSSISPEEITSILFSDIHPGCKPTASATVPTHNMDWDSLSEDELNGKIWSQISFSAPVFPNVWLKAQPDKNTISNCKRQKKK